MDEIYLVPYDARWPQLFEEEAARVRTALRDATVTRIEHVGSTAVEGLTAKPIIDILIGVESLEAAVANGVPELEAMGYSLSLRGLSRQ